MDQLKKEKLNLTIKNSQDYFFEVSEDGIYLIEIIASAKSWWQNFKSLKSFFNDDDLTLKINAIEFPKLNKKRGLFDGEVAWNGNNLKGLSKTNIFIINLEKGNHILHFLADQKPTLESVAIFKINETETSYLPEENNPAQDGDRRQWLTIIPVDVLLKNLNIRAAAKNYPEKRDDDDMKIIIDGTIQENEADKSHKNWYWCGRILNGQEKEFNRELNLEKGLHYIELWADKSPVLSFIKITLASQEQPPESGKRIPTADDPEWTGNFNDDPDDILLARLIFGEANNQPVEAKEWVGWSVINRTEAKSWWPDSIRGVILQEGQYDPFKTGDPAFNKIINPFYFDGVSEKDKESWHGCYEIAKDIILKKTTNPTEATHFHGIGVDQDWYEKHIVPNGKFLRKIGDTYFYWSPN